MATDLDFAGLQGGGSHRHRGKDGQAPARSARLKVRSWLIGLLAVFGGLVLIGIIVFAARLDIFGRIAADRILANAIRPSGREMPATAGALAYTSADIQIIGGMGQGLSCSLPWILEQLAFPIVGDNSPIGLEMRQACAYHDYCYRHGAATYGYTQADCDFALQVQAFRMCAFIEQDEGGREKDSDCMRDARLVTLGVRAGGSDAFRPLSVRDVPSIEDGDRAETAENRSTYFEFDPYPTKSVDYTVYRIADAPPRAKAPLRRKAIYRFRIKPSGIHIFYSTGAQEFTPYAEIAGNPNYLTSPPVVVHTDESFAPVDWFVWWQRVDENQTTGRLLGMAPALFQRDMRRSCFGLPTDCDTSAIFAVRIGNDPSRPEDPQIDQLRPADFGLAATQGISMVTLRHHECAGKGNAPCYVHVLVKTAPSEAERKTRWQPQEPLSINDRLSPRSTGRDSDRYRNFAALPFVLDPKAPEPPIIAWTRRDTNYQNDAILRRAAVGSGKNKADRNDDVAISQGTALLQGFAEAHEPAFILGRSKDNPILVSLTDDTAAKGASSIAVSAWPLPPPDRDDKMLMMPTVHIDTTRCHPGLEAEWLHRPPQILGRGDGRALAIFSLLRPYVSKDWTAAKLQLAILKINVDGSCPEIALRRPEIILETTKPSGGDKMKDPLERGRDAFVRMSRAPILIADLDGDGSVEVMLADGPQRNVPRFLCSIINANVCINPSDSQ